MPPTDEDDRGALPEDKRIDPEPDVVEAHETVDPLTQYGDDVCQDDAALGEHSPEDES